MSEKKASQPLMVRRDYDTPEAAMVKPVVPPQYTPEEMVEENGSPMVPSNPKGFKLICPTCEETNAYEPEEDVTADTVLVCPKCASKVPVDMFAKTASGVYRIKQASYLDPNFKAIREILPKRPAEAHLTKSDTAKLLKHIDRLESVYAKVQKTLRGD